MISYRKPHRVKKKKSIFKSKFLWIGIFILFISSVIIYYLFFSNFFKVKKIVILGVKKVSEQELRDLVSENFGKKIMFFPQNNIFLLNLKTIKQNILSVFPNVYKAELNRDFPETLKVNITERMASGIFCGNDRLKEEKTVQCFLIDKYGVIFENVPQDNMENLPRIENPNIREQLLLGNETVNANLLSKILDIFSELKSSNFSIKEIVIVSDDMIDVRTSENWGIYFNPQKDLDWQFVKLNAVLEKYIPPEKREELEYIELRFGNLAPFKYRETPQ